MCIIVHFSSEMEICTCYGNDIVTHWYVAGRARLLLQGNKDVYFWRGLSGIHVGQFQAVDTRPITQLYTER